MLHVGPSKLRRFIAEGSLRVRDPRISARSLVALRENRISAGAVATEAVEGVPQKHRKNASSYSWGSAAKLLGVDVGQVREWIVEGKLKIVDGFATERAFQDFCKKRGVELSHRQSRYGKNSKNSIGCTRRRCQVGNSHQQSAGAIVFRAK